MGQSNIKNFNPEFPFSEGVFLSTEPMTDEEFAEFVLIKNDEIPIEEVNFNCDLSSQVRLDGSAKI